MGKLDVSKLMHMSPTQFRVLVAVELGMKNHELVPSRIIASIASLRGGGCHKLLRDLCTDRLVSYERGPSYDGYRLNNSGYDYLALKAFIKAGNILKFGRTIGVGKESDIYTVSSPDDEILALKIHRLGRTSFRKIKEKRDYHQHRNSASWIYLSRLSAEKEYAFLQILHQNDFPVPKPVAYNRHCILMGLIDGSPLAQVSDLEDPEALYEELMELVVRLGNNGMIHGDYNEFNLMITKDDHAILIDFPQMVSIDHANAEWYFDRDVQCIRTLFKRKFRYESELYPKFEDIVREGNLDIEVAASGFSKELKKELKKSMLHSKIHGDDSAEDTDEEESAEDSDCDEEGSVEDSLEDNEDEGCASNDEEEELNEDHNEKELKIKKESLEEAAESLSNLDLSGEEENGSELSTASTKQRIHQWAKSSTYKEKQKQMRHRQYVKGEASAKTRIKRDNRMFMSDFSM